MIAAGAAQFDQPDVRLLVELADDAPIAPAILGAEEVGDLDAEVAVAAVVALKNPSEVTSW